ncbi:Zinc finger protein bud20 [Penicillium maclennaniae]|uniref:Zinc finger protein bud20 n=1 Tax=Penicillium maclennaniae TaxID=1343394 RepID=UPI002541DD78|nr:Zinc finger protein bud20 [Penicillium maclennaniae]KAJ5662486.1 Zinc finger protein bud20 [Penicillium maclennaniae]
MGALRRQRVKCKRITRGFDQIRSDLESPRHLEQYKETKDAEDLPGLGRHYCVECAKWFESEYNMKAHTKGKNHKRRVRQLEDEPHSQRIAEAAVGIGAPDNGKRADDTVEMQD